jgi:hypothetical protein
VASREQDELPRPGTRSAAGKVVEVMENEVVRRVSVSSIAWLGLCVFACKQTVDLGVK